MSSKAQAISSALPPMLSPTLPPFLDTFSLPKLPLSPTLPAAYEKSSAAEAVKQTLLVTLKYPVKSEPPKSRPVNRASSKHAAQNRDFSSSPEPSGPEERVIPVAKASVPNSAPATPAAPPAAPAPVPAPEEKRQKETPSSTTSPAEQPAPKRPAVLPPEYNRYIKDLQKCLDLARTKKHDADAAMAAKKHRIAALMSSDAIICFIKAFDCEDRAARSLNKTPKTRSWETLPPYVDRQMVYLESVDADLAGVCYFTRAILYLHIASLLPSSSKNPATLATKLQSFQNSVSDFRRGLKMLPPSIIKDKYGLDWTENKRNPSTFDPKNDECVLPLHVNSTVQDAAALYYRVACKWAQSENIDYTWAFET